MLEKLKNLKKTSKNYKKKVKKLDKQFTRLDKITSNLQGNLNGGYYDYSKNLSQ